AAHEAIWATKIADAPKPSVKVVMSDEHELVLQNASADYTQAKFDVADVIDGKGKKTGWGIASENGKAHSAVFEVVGKIPGGQLTLKLVQNFGAKSTIGRFRFSVTSNPLPVQVLPTNIVSILVISYAQRSTDQQQELAKWFTQYARSTEQIRSQIKPLK